MKQEMLLFQLHNDGESGRQKKRNCASVAVLWVQKQTTFSIKASIYSLKDYIIMFLKTKI